MPEEAMLHVFGIVISCVLTALLTIIVWLLKSIKSTIGKVEQSVIETNKMLWKLSERVSALEGRDAAETSYRSKR